MIFNSTYFNGIQVIVPYFNMTAPTPIHWLEKNCTILHYDCDSSNTWIPYIWVSHSPHLEHLRVQEIQQEYRNLRENTPNIDTSSYVKKHSKKNSFIKKIIKLITIIVRTSK